MGEAEHAEREAAEVDLFIRKLRPKDFSTAPGRTAAIGSRPATHIRYVETARRPGVIRLCVALSVALGVALPYWPYPRACGWWLVLYLLAVVMVVVAGIWSVRLTWIARLGYFHTAALLVLCWGVTLTAVEVAPRADYTQAENGWVCSTN